MTLDEALSAAWSMLAPERDRSAAFPRGFWPDLARVAVQIMEQGTADISLSWCPTMCRKGNYPQPQPTKAKAKTRAENTAALLAKLGEQS